MRATYSPSTRGMHHISLRHGLRPFSANRRRTVSPERLSCPVSLTMASASSSSVQRARPLGGFAQAVATSKASSLPESLRSAPGRGSSLSARSRLPSTKRRLVRYTVEPPTATAQAIYAYSRLFKRPPAEADMQRHFRVSPPSVHQMVLTLERVG